MSELLGLNLQDLVDAAGDEEGVDTAKKGAFTDPFQPNVAYPVEITEQEYALSKSGYEMTIFKFDIVKSDGSVGGGAKRWFCLPVFSDEKQAAEDPEKLKQLKDTFGNRLLSLLRSIDRAAFSIRMEKVGGKWKFYDGAGEEMSKQAKVAQEKEIGKAVLGAAKQLKSGKLSLVGRRMYYVRTPSKTKANEFYDNFFSTAPDKFALAEM